MSEMTSDGCRHGFIWGCCDICNLEREVNKKHDEAYQLKQQLTAAQAEIARLKAELWVANDRSLRTYDGLTEKADKYDLLQSALDVAVEGLKFYSKKSNWKWHRLVNGGVTSNIIEDDGVRANAALEKIKQIRGEK